MDSFLTGKSGGKAGILHGVWHPCFPENFANFPNYFLTKQLFEKKHLNGEINL